MSFRFLSHVLTAMLVIFFYGIVTGSLAEASSVHSNNQEIVSLIEHLGDGPPGDTNEAVSKLLEVGSPVIPYLTEILNKTPSHSAEGGLTAKHWARLRAAHCLSMLNAESVSKIILMILRGLERYGYHKQAYEGATRFLRGMERVFAKTGTVWENYNPESVTEESKRANRDFVGWTGLGPITILIETIIGIEAEAQSNTITWNIERTDRHGIKNIRFGDTVLTMIAKHRISRIEKASIYIKSNKPFKLILVREQNRRAFNISAGESTLTF